MGRGLLYCHIYASERTPLGRGGVGSGTDRDKRGVVGHESRVLVSISIGCVVLMSFCLPQRTISSVGWLPTLLSNKPLSAYTVGFSLAAIHL